MVYFLNVFVIYLLLLMENSIQQVQKQPGSLATINLNGPAHPPSIRKLCHLATSQYSRKISKRVSTLACLKGVSTFIHTTLKLSGQRFIINDGFVLNNVHMVTKLFGTSVKQSELVEGLGKGRGDTGSKQIGIYSLHGGISKLQKNIFSKMKLLTTLLLKKI